MESGREGHKGSFNFVKYCKIRNVYEKQTKDGSDNNKILGFDKAEW